MCSDENQKLNALAVKEIRADNTVCEVCCKFDAHQFGEQFLCVDCYQKSGSCCAGEFCEKDGE